MIISFKIIAPLSLDIAVILKISRAIYKLTCKLIKSKIVGLTFLCLTKSDSCLSMHAIFV